MLNSIASSETPQEDIFEVADLLATMTNRHYEDAADSAHEAQMANLPITGAMLRGRAMRFADYGERWDRGAEMQQILQALKKLGVQLRILRKQHNMRRCELAEMADLPEEQLYYVEQGLLNRCETIELLLALAEGLPNRRYSAELVNCVVESPPILLDRFLERIHTIRKERQACSDSFQQIERAILHSFGSLPGECNDHSQTILQSPDDCLAITHSQLSLFE